ncbi:MAG: hypothetical protein M0P27_09570 [Bacteroidales bacterium]|nr:hypothetical protein [Bacteroidales bacterium]
MITIIVLSLSCMREDKICQKLSQSTSISDSKAIEFIAKKIFNEHITGQQNFNAWINDSCKKKICLTLFIRDKEEPLTKFDNIIDFKREKIHWLAEKMVSLFYYCNKRNLFSVRIEYSHKVVTIPRPRIVDNIYILGVSLDIDHLETITGWDRYSPFFKSKDSTIILSQNKTIEDVKRILNIEYDGTGGIFLKQ